MSTHRFRCVVCGKETNCNAEEHMLGASGGCYDADPKIEFCSVGCFVELRRRLDDRMAFAKEEHPEWFQKA